MSAGADAAERPRLEAGALGRDRARARIRVRVEGTVQGVGFRPYVYRLAHELELAGYVLNDVHGVLLEIEGPDDRLERFLSRLDREAPPLAVLERVRVERCRPSGAPSSFEIRPSPQGASADAPVTPDSATCGDCLRELLDPGDRRYRYPFINCTNCGPRFTIVQGIPYDRPLTTMAGFRMCAACEAEYQDPEDRRFHAQPNACPQCGPRVSLLDAAGDAVELDGPVDVLSATASALASGMILAIKGIGGYHLACRADDEAAVARLRARKHREHKPFALMAAGVEGAQLLVELDRHARELLTSPARPIVLAPRLGDAPVAGAVAPGTPELGVMLPYSPLHHLLAHDAGGALVMTSGNVSDEPICFRDEEAVSRLGQIADLFLVHDRPIHTRTDDSVVRVVNAAGQRVGALQRRSRGYVPASLSLPGEGAPRPLLACGAELKSTFCVVKGRRAWVSHHIGDLQNLETLRSFSEGIEHFQRLFAVQPEVAVHDLHPDYLSTRYALEREQVELVAVQHHHAHMAACMAEHGELGVAVGAIFDGSGYGLDGTVWGGELLVGELGSFRRAGHLQAVRLPGGEQAIRQPWRMACAWLHEADGSDPAMPQSLAESVPPTAWRQVARLAETGLASPQTTSVGRLFDAVSALCGIRTEAHYEGQAAIELEARCDPHERGSYPMPLHEGGDGQIVLDARETIRAVAADVGAGVSASRIGARFHTALARTTVDACARAAARAGTEVAVLSGGVFANRRLLEQTAEGLTQAGLRVLVPRSLPAGDGGISYGQAALAVQAML